MPDTFITGGSGWVGGALLRRLVADGRHVAALARSDRAAEIVGGLGAEAVRGDLLEAGEWERRLSGCDTLFHVAGEVAMCDRRRLLVNVVGTRRILRAAASAGIRRVVFTSSAAAIGERRGQVGREDPPADHHRSAYGRSKREAERTAFALGRDLGVEVVAVNPSSVQGPGRTHGSARIFIAFLQGRLRWAVRTRMPLVFVGDCVAGHLAAEARGRPGERYLLNGWSPTVAEAVALLGEVAGVERRVRFLPAWMLSAAATVTGAVWLKGEPPLCRAMAREVAHGHVFDSTKAERELGIRFTPPELWLRETVEWYRAEGVVWS